MKIIYHCYGGSHSSVTSAAIHLHQLPNDRLPRMRDFMQVPYFDRQVAGEHGLFRLMGRDAAGHEVYVVGRRSLKKFEQLISGLAELLDVPREDFMLINSMPCVNWVMKVGGFISRCLRIEWLGRPIVIWGTRQMFLRYIQLVEQVKTALDSQLATNRMAGEAPRCR